MSDAFTAPLAQTEACALGGRGTPPSSIYTPLPAGEYQMEVVESEYAATADGLGFVLKTKAQVVGGAFDQRPFYLNFMLEHADDTAQEIGQRDFAGLRRATGVLSPNDSEELHWIPFRVEIGAQIRERTGELENVIKQYLFEDEAA